MINSAGTESKYGLKLAIPNAIGIIGSSDGESIFAETKARIEVVDVSGAFVMDVEGQVKNSPNWYVITTITGAITGTLDISTYDRIRYNITNVGGVGTLYASGYLLTNAASGITDAELRASPVPVLSGLSSYITQYVDDAAPITYLGDITLAGIYMITRITDTAGDIVIDYANISNNPSRTTLSLAWTNRVTLTYDVVSNLTGV